MVGLMQFPPSLLLSGRRTFDRVPEGDWRQYVGVSSRSKAKNRRRPHAAGGGKVDFQGRPRMASDGPEKLRFPPLQYVFVSSD